MDLPEQVPLLRVRGLKTYVFTARGVGRAVDGVSFSLARGETLGIVGESGSGKSLTGLSILRLLPTAARTISGEVLFEGRDVLKLPERAMRKIRGGRIGLLLQDALTALNPVLSIGDQIREPLVIHQGLKGAQVRRHAIDLLRMLRIPAPELRLKSYPHQMSGGMRQRSLGAIALAAAPDVLIADEPTTALDPTLEAAYLEYLKAIQRQRHLSILLTTHDFNVVRRMCDRLAVMYAGRIVESGKATELLERPRHPYTEALLNAVPDVRSQPKRLAAIPGQPPSIYQRDPGCSFAPRCPYVMARCRDEEPPDVPLEHGSVSCWRYV